MPKIPESVRERAERLRRSINRHRFLVHVKNIEELSPEALDSLKDELVKLEERYPELIVPDSPTQRVAGAPLPEFVKVRHEVPQWSLNDAFTEEEIRAFDERVKKVLAEAGLSKKPSYTCELKIDGLKMVLTYERGKLLRAATRGDGSVGEDVTHNVRTIESVPLSLERPIDCVVEGEVWMSKENLASLNRAREKAGEAPFANPRNVAAGSIRQLDPKVASSRKLDSFVYDLARSSEPMPATQVEELALLGELGFKVNRHAEVCPSIDEVIAFWKRWTLKRDKEPYLIDGVVVKVNERSSQEVLGYTGKGPRFAIAIKFPAEQVTTLVESIAFQIGRTGVITPVAHLRPARVSGVVVSRATLHNEDQIKRLDVREGDTVVLQRAGDVIPEIVSVVKEMRTGKEKAFRWPSKIEGCGGDGSIERVPGEAAWRCVNKHSFDQVKRRLYHFVSRRAFDIEGLGPSTIDLLLERGLVATFDDLFTLTEGDLEGLPGFAERSILNLLDSIRRARRVPLGRLIIGLSIEQVGEETAEDLASYFGTLEKLGSASEEELQGVPGVGPVVARSILNWFRAPEHRELLKRLLPHLSVVRGKKQAAGGPLSGKTFVVTGVLGACSRDEAHAAVKALGGSVSSSVSSKTDYVVVGENPGASKVADAKRYGTKELSEKDFLKLIGR